jgi:uncharacterized protein (TIGR02996 family)
MSDEDGFLRAIQENRDDFPCRLVYADWLEEQGDPRGEYLRLSCRLAELRERIDPTWLRAVREGRFQAEEVRLSSGRDVYLRELRQFRVYEGLLEGLPTTELNQRIINRIVAGERDRPLAGEPYLLRPEERPIEYQRAEPYPFGEPASIPAVACIGRFHCFQPARESRRDFSALVVIWFQEDFALPIDPKIWPRLLAIDWERHAADYDY